ncbi:aquaporin [Microbacterium phyllosphaerae]|uniref:aquaporin n=1 Tax=Microbacterium phyllosphaerae TaxID=124798 RepID=UPI003D653ED1
MTKTTSDARHGSSTMTVRLTAEAFGSSALVLAIVGAAMFAARFGAGTETTDQGIGFIGIALAAGFALTSVFYAFGPISGGHFNPAVTVGVAAAGRMPWREVPAYVIAQCIGGLIASTLVFLIGLFGPEGWLEARRVEGFASNGFAAASPAGFGLGAAIIVEALFAAVLVLVILGVTHPVRGTAFGGVVTGLTLAVIHLVILPIDFASVNPARSIATAVYGNVEALTQLWVFVVFPIVGALLAGFAYRGLFDVPDRSVDSAAERDS